MLDANPVVLEKIGSVCVCDDLVIVDGFSAEGGSCRDVSALAIVWAIGRLQTELQSTLQRPGDSNVCVS